MRRKKNERERERPCVGGWVFVIANPVKINKQNMHEKPPEAQQQRASVFIKPMTAHVRLCYFKNTNLYCVN